uniref:Blue-sensitive rhodopsin n=1 Tax=Plebejus glandon TaxID=374600 RepID=Q00LL9_PLEGL|nr:blue-sensitive rhodopsin [Agriades glandon]
MDNSTENIGPTAYAFQMIEEETKENILGYNYPEEYQFMVQDHWRSYPAINKYWHYSLALIYTMLFIASITGNGIVIWIFSTSKALRSPSNMFVINLAVFDVMMMLEMPIFVLNSYHHHIVGYQVVCNVYATLGSISGFGGAITNAVIAYDRYKTISCPLDGRVTKSQALALIMMTWMWSLPFTILPAFRVWGKFVPEGFLTTCSFDYLTEDSATRMFVLVCCIWDYFLPIFILCYYYSRLFGAVRTHEKMLREQAKKMNVKSLSNKDDGGASVEIRIAKVAFTIFFLFVCAWTPYAFVTLVGAFGDRSILTPVATMVPAVCAKTVSCIDPWVYAINHPKYRAELTKRLPWLGVREKDPDTASSSSTATSQTQHPTAEA